MSGDGVPWTIMGAADFDKRRAVKGYRPPPADQAGLFYMPAPERPKAVESAAQLDGQADLFGTDQP